LASISCTSTDTASASKVKHPGFGKVIFLCRVQATQRAGRAGRVCNGKCYRLYTTSFFEKEMSETTVPVIQRTNMLTAVLYLKSLPLDIDVLAFDYLDSPGVSPASNSGPLQKPVQSSAAKKSGVVLMTSSHGDWARKDSV